MNEAMRKLGAKRSVIRELFEYAKARKAEIGADKVFDFTLGNPSVPAPDAVRETLVRLLTTEDPVVLHGYTSAQGDRTVRVKIADYIRATENVEVDPDLIYMTCGAAASLTCTLTALCCPGDEVIVNTPYFPEYKVFIERTGAKCVEVASDPLTLEPDVSALAAAITEKTVAVLINYPNNPTGAVITEARLSALSDLLRKKEAEFGKRITLISDEPYRELVYDGVKVPYVTAFYDDAVVCYSFSKSLSLPGDRIGYVLVSPKMRDTVSVYQAIMGAGRALGFVCAPTLFQFLVAECLGKTSDISVYDRNRTLLYRELTADGYSVIRPSGAFYLFVKSPSGDAGEFCERAKKHELLVVPSDDFGYPGYVRIAYCVTTDMIERALPAFRALMASYER